MKNLFKNPLFYGNVFLLVLLILFSVSINPNSTNLPSFAKKALAAVQNILGNGTVNYLAAFTDVNQIGNSIIYDTGTNVGIGTTNPAQKLDIGSGNISANDHWIGAVGKWASQLGGGASINYSDCVIISHTEGGVCGVNAWGTCPNNYVMIGATTGLRYPDQCVPAQVKCCKLN